MGIRPKLKVSFTERDLGMGYLMKQAEKLRKKPFVKVGVTQKKGSKLREDGKKTTADIAAIHEYGAPDAGIPERSFIRSTVTQNQAKYDKHIEKLHEDLFDAEADMPVERALGLIGQEVSSDIKETIRAGIAPPLKPATIRAKNAGEIAKAKGFLGAKPSAKDFQKGVAARLTKAENLVSTGGDSTALIDTGQLVGAVSYEVDLEGEAAE